MDRSALRPLAAGLVALEGVAVLGLGIWLAVETFATTDAHGLAVGLGVMAAVIGGVLVACAVGVRRRRAWARGPVITWQLVTAFLAMRVAGAGLWVVAVPVLVLALAIGVLLAGPWVIERQEAPTA